MQGNTHKVIQTIKTIKSTIRRARLLTDTGIAASTLFILLTLCIMKPLTWSESMTEAEAAGGTAASTSLTVATNPLELDILVNSTNGTFSSTSSSITAYTTNYTGYTLTISADDSDGQLVSSSSNNTSGKDQAMDSIGSAIAADTFSGSSNTTYNNLWGYMPSDYVLNGTAYTNNTTTYLPSPTDTATTLKATTSPNGSTESTAAENKDTYTITLGARADYTKPAGTYTKTFTLTATANPIVYSITFKDATNDSTISSWASNIVSQSTSDTSITLPSTTPTRTGYTFAGWCSTAPTSTTYNTAVTCGGTSYSASGTYYINQAKDNTDINLYAYWTPVFYTCTKQYRLQAADGSYPSYTTDSTERVAFNNPCSYSKTVTNYNSNSAKSTSVANMTTSGATLSLDFPRNTYTLTVSYDSSYIGSVTGGGTYRWGYAVPITATASSGNEFTSWSQTSGTASSFANSSSSSTTFTMPLSAATVYASGKSSGYTVTYNANGGNGSIDSQTVSPGSSVTLADNAYTKSGYYFKGWGANSTTTVTNRTNESYTPTSNVTFYAIWGTSANTTLYNAVKSLTRGTQTVTKLRTEITKANSGVYTYNSSVFGTASDSSTSNAIYYYRGILDNVTSTYGSDGDAANYPNYVRFAGYCWRIVRTTGSGGVKLIYNGTYGATTSGSCANATAKAQLVTSAFNGPSASNGYTSLNYDNMSAVGYTYNPSVTGSTTATALSTILGSNSNYSVNSSPSIIKQYIEQTWYKNNMTGYTSRLEANAGYCNDRTVYPDGSYAASDLVSESTTVINYDSSTVYYFGAFARNSKTDQKPSLTCPRGTVDLYTTSSASAGNKQLTYPAALLTADEAAFAGSGCGSTSTPYNANSYLRSGPFFWLLSPYYRDENGGAGGFFMYSSGILGGTDVPFPIGVRPAISLTSGTTISSGSGTATDPWVVN